MLVPFCLQCMGLRKPDVITGSFGETRFDNESRNHKGHRDLGSTFRHWVGVGQRGKGGKGQKRYRQMSEDGHSGGVVRGTKMEVSNGGARQGRTKEKAGSQGGQARGSASLYLEAKMAYYASWRCYSSSGQVSGAKLCR